MKNKIVFFLLAVIVIFPSCSKNAAVEIKEWTQFQDQFFKVSFNYPKDWVVVTELTKVVFSSSAEAAEKFFDHDPRKADGVQIVIASERSDSMQDYTKYIQSFQTTKTAEGFAVKEIEDGKIDGLTSKKVSYAGAYDEKTKIRAICAATLKDSTIYYVQYAAFNDLFDSYKPVFDSVMASLTLPQKIIRQKGVDPAIPLVQVEKYSDNYIQLEYPANFGSNEMSKKGDMISGVRFAGNQDGMRNDCSIDIDIRPAKNLALAKVVEQNSKFFNPKSQNETKVGSDRAIYLNYVPQKVRNIDSRVYFIVKNDKIYRIILNYYAPMKKDFLPAFEKVIASIRLK